MWKFNFPMNQVIRPTKFSQSGDHNGAKSDGLLVKLVASVGRDDNVV